MKHTILYLLTLLSFMSCAPYGSLSNTIKIKPEESHDVFAALLKRHASRIDVEVIAVLGENYMNQNYASFNGPKLRESVIHSLSTTGMSKDSPGGDSIYRVSSIAQAKKILAKTWPETDFSPNSDLGLLFKRYPRASIAIMECDNQRIFFFDKDDRLVSIYPDSGGGC